MAERIRFRGDPGRPRVGFFEALEALVGPVRDERVPRRDRGYRNTPRRGVGARWFWVFGTKDAPRGYTFGTSGILGTGNLLAQKRALRRQVERELGKLSGRQWVRWRRSLKYEDQS